MLDLPRDEVHVWLVDAANVHEHLRSLLARYLGRPPETLDFGKGVHGKPFLVGESSVEFNLSHSGELAAIAVAHDRSVGVDVERRRSVHAEAGVARRIMNDGEHGRYTALPAAERREFLLWVWARKEALVKAAGVGLRASLSTISCEPTPADRFKVVDLDVPRYAAAVAAEGHDWKPVVQEKGPTG